MLSTLDTLLLLLLLGCSPSSRRVANPAQASMLSPLYAVIFLLGCFATAVSLTPSGEAHNAMTLLLFALVLAPIPVSEPAPEREPRPPLCLNAMQHGSHPILR